MQVISCEDGYLNLMDDAGVCREDLKCPSKDTELGKEMESKLLSGETFMVSTSGNRAANAVAHRTAANWRFMLRLTFSLQ